VSAEVRLADMRRRDLKAVMAIEHEVSAEPWSVNVFTSELALRRGRAYRVARLGRQIIGFVGVMFVDDEAHITTLAVAAAHQRQGVATVLLLDAVRRGLEIGARNLSLEVAANNEGAQALYRSFGMAPVGIRKGYYPQSGQDAIVMWAYDIDGSAYAKRLDGLEARVRSST
jgi:[ribosomal protein S18]-alanine N-acetyltransferase